MQENETYKVQVKDLCKNFGNLEVLKNCSFNIRQGEFVCVVGPTGCGKTTFLNLLTCLTEPTSGEILLDGERANPKKHNIAFVFQEPSAFPWMTVRKNLSYGLEIKKRPQKEIEERVNTIMDLMGLTQYQDAFPAQLSVSTEQKVVIGRAFAMNPDLLLMDEPYGQMDVKVRFYLEDEVIRLWKELKSTVIFVTHNTEEAVYLAQRILILSQKPARVKDSMEINLPRPRDVYSKEFIALRNKVTEQIKWW